MGCNKASLTDPPTCAENPPDRDQAGPGERSDCEQGQPNWHVRRTKERPAETRYQIDNRIEHRDRLPNWRQHGNRIEGPTQKNERRDDQQGDQLQLFKIACPNTDDEPKQ